MQNRSAMFDTLATANTLKEAGFEEARTAAIMGALRHAVTEKVATKADLGELRADLYHALLMQAASIIGLTVALLKIL